MGRVDKIRLDKQLGRINWAESCLAISSKRGFKKGLLDGRSRGGQIHYHEIKRGPEMNTSEIESWAKKRLRLD